MKHNVEFNLLLTHRATESAQSVDILGSVGILRMMETEAALLNQQWHVFGACKIEIDPNGCGIVFLLCEIYQTCNLIFALRNGALEVYSSELINSNSKLIDKAAEGSCKS